MTVRNKQDPSHASVVLVVSSEKDTDCYDERLPENQLAVIVRGERHNKGKEIGR